MKPLARALGIGVFLFLVPISALWATVAAYGAPLWLDLLDAAWFVLNLLALGYLLWTPPTRKDLETGD